MFRRCLSRARLAIASPHSLDEARGSGQERIAVGSRASRYSETGFWAWRQASTEGGRRAQKPGGTFAPLREPTFRRIWTASLFSSFGQLILGVGAAWEMTRLSNSPSMVALVQTALMLPLMLVALPAGAVADMFDRRKIALTGLGFSIAASAALAAIAFFGLITPWMLLFFCVLIGAGVALYAPSWQASIGEQVAEEHLPAAIGLGTISYNLARSFGPAIGGLVVLAFGAQAAFGITAAFYVPLWLAFFAWQRQHRPSRLPPERIDRAIASGGRYARHSPPIRIVLIRAFTFGVASASSAALAPLVAKVLLGGGDQGAGHLRPAARRAGGRRCDRRTLYGDAAPAVSPPRPSCGSARWSPR